MKQKNKQLATRILSGFLCFVIILGIALPFVTVNAAEATIEGNNNISIDLNNWQKKVTRYVYTVTDNPGTWDVLYGIEEGGTTNFYRIPDAIDKIGNGKNTFPQGLTFYKISDYQIAIVVDFTYADRSTASSHKVKIINGNISKEITINLEYKTFDNVYNYGSQIYMSTLSIDATTIGINYYEPINGFKNSQIGVENDNVIGAVVSPESSGIKILKYRDFIEETTRNFGYTWTDAQKQSYHATDDYYYLLKNDYTADGTYMVTFTMASGTSITKNIVVNSGNLEYTANVELDYHTTNIDIPTQVEGDLRIPLDIEIYQGVLMQTSVPYKVIISPAANGIKIEGNELVIKPTAIAGNYKIKVLAATSSTCYGLTEFKLNRIESDYITINCADSLVIPASGNTTTILTASVYKNGNYTTSETVTWSLGSFYNGVRIEGNKLIVSSDANADIISIIATLNSNSSVTSKKFITLTEPDVNIVPDTIKISGITNNTWEPVYPYGQSLNVTLYAMNGNTRNDNVELGLKMDKNIEGIRIVKGGEYNSFEIQTNGVYELTYINLIAYSVNHPEVQETIRLKILPKFETTVFSNSQIVKGGSIEANATLIINGEEDIDAIMVIALYKDNQLISVTPQTNKNVQKVTDGKMIVFSGSVKLPKDISGYSAKIMLMKGTTLADATELLAKPLVIK